MQRTTQIPRKYQDELVNDFKTEEDGEPLTFSIIVYHGYLFKLHIIDKESGK